MIFGSNALSEKEKRTFFTEILCSNTAEERFRELARSGELKELFPEVYAMIGVTQPPEFHPEGDVFEHTMIMLRHMVFPDPLLGWSVLLHDVGKPVTRSVESTGRIRFFSHEEKGAELAEAILKRFGFEDEDAGVICHAVRNHMRFAHVAEMRPAKVARLIREPFFGMELELHRLDCISCHGKMTCFDFLLEKCVQTPEEPGKLVTGRDLLERGFSEGVVCGKILNEIRKAQLAGVITTRSEALNYIERIK